MKENPNDTKELVRAIIKNTYRTLMTRGMKGGIFIVQIKKQESILKR